MIISSMRRTPNLESPRGRATEGIPTWAPGLVTDGPCLVPERVDPAIDVMPTGTVEHVEPIVASPRRYRSLLVPVDGSPFGEHALPLALGIARRSGAEVRVVHVHLPMEPVLQRARLQVDTGLDSWLRRRQQQYLDGLIRRLARATTVSVRPIFLEGEIATSLCAVARSGADLVVMATHGRGPLARLWHGSIAEALIARLSIPLMLVRGYNAPAELTGDPLMRHVLVPLDGSRFAEQALEPAIALGMLTTADLTLLRMAPPVTDESVGCDGGSRRPSGAGRQAEAWRYLRRVANRLGGRTLRAHPRVVLDGQPTAEAILRYARTHDVDLIALATRGRGVLSQLFRGGVADRVVRGASVPVLVFRPAGGPEGGVCLDESAAGSASVPTAAGPHLSLRAGAAGFS